MASRPGTRARILVATAGILGGLVLGILVVGLVGGSKQPATYAPFRAGYEDELVEHINEGGPVFIPDPTGGDRGFYLVRNAGQIVALHVVPPGGEPSCPVQYDMGQFTDCDGRVVDPTTLRQFRVTTRPEGDEQAVYVDPRGFLSPTATVTPRS